MKGLAKDGSITRYQIQDMIGYLQDRMINGEFDSSSQASYSNQNSLNSSAKKVNPSNNNNFMDFSDAKRNNPLSEIRELNFEMDGDFGLDGNNEGVDLEQELNRVDIIGMKFEQIILSFEKLVRTTENPDIVDM